MNLSLEQQYMLSVLHSQYHSCWCCDDFRGQAINSHGIDPQSRNILSIEVFISKHNQWNMIDLHTPVALLWHYNGHDGISNHQSHDCLLNHSFRRRSKKTSKLRVTGLCVRNAPKTSEFPAQMASKRFPFDDVIMSGNIFVRCSVMTNTARSTSQAMYLIVPNRCLWANNQGCAADYRSNQLIKCCLLQRKLMGFRW